MVDIGSRPCICRPQTGLNCIWRCTDTNRIPFKNMTRKFSCEYFTPLYLMRFVSLHGHSRSVSIIVLSLFYQLYTTFSFITLTF